MTVCGISQQEVLKIKRFVKLLLLLVLNCNIDTGEYFMDIVLL